MHFGHCQHFAMVDVDPSAKRILKREDIAAPPHGPRLLPPWLVERGVTYVIAGNMAARTCSPLLGGFLSRHSRPGRLDAPQLMFAGI